MSILYHKDDTVAIHLGDCRDTLTALEPGSARTCVTSPPYYGLRDYGHDAQIGLEPTPDAYVEALVAVFREVRRVLADDGTLWLNLGDSYAGSRAGAGDIVTDNRRNPASRGVTVSRRRGNHAIPDGLKPKNLMGIPWRVAFALQADGWYLRSDIIWHKPNPMPESVTDRPTRAHEYLFLLSKSARYYYDAAAIKEPAKYPGGPNSPESIKSPYGQGFTRRADKQSGHGRRHAGFNARWDGMTRDEQVALGANKRSVWTVATKPYKGAHFATFPPDLIRPCILAGAPAGGVVLDPFGGSGTTGAVAKAHGRKAVLIEANPDYCALSMDRCGITPPRTGSP